LRKFLLIRFSSIGDIVLTTALIRCLRKKFPEAEIRFLTKKSFVPLLLNNPYLDGVIGMEKELSEVKPIIRAWKPDQIIDLHSNLRSGLLKISLGLPSATIPKFSFKRWIMVQTQKRKAIPHINERYFSVVKKFGVEYDAQGLDYYFLEAENNLLAWFQSLQLSDFDVWVIGATHFTKRLPEQKVMEGIKLRNRKVILVGGQNEQAAGERIAAACPELALNFCGKTNYDQTAYLIKQSTLVFSNDTGFMHIAAALKKKIVSFWGGTVPELGMTALLPNEMNEAVIIQNNEIPCRPCSKIGKSECPLKHFHCMEQLDMHAIKDC
jgi:heptosyltransferase-2